MKYCLIWLFVFATGCASTPNGLQSDPEALRVFNVSEPYQLIFKRLVENHQECSHTPLLPLGQSIFETNNYPDLRLATIVLGASGVGTQIYLSIEISEVSSNESKIKMWTKIRTDKKANQVKRIAEGGIGCDL